jgi:hypothetical protein
MTTKKGPPQPPAPPPRVRPIAPAPGTGRVPVIRPIPQRPVEARTTQRSAEPRREAPPPDDASGQSRGREPRNELGRPRGELGKDRPAETRPKPHMPPPKGRVPLPATTMKSQESPLRVRDPAPAIDDADGARATRDLGRGYTDRVNEPPRDAGFPALARAIPEPRAWTKTEDKPRFPPPPTRLPSERPPDSKREDEPTKLRGRLSFDPRALALPNLDDPEDRIERTVVMADGPSGNDAATEVGMMPPDMADMARGPTRPLFEPMDPGEETKVLATRPDAQQLPYAQRFDQTAALGAPPVAMPPGYGRPLSAAPSVHPPPVAPPFAFERARAPSMRVQPHAELAPTTSPVVGFFLFAAPLALATLIIAALAIVL